MQERGRATREGFGQKTPRGREQGPSLTRGALFIVLAAIVGLLVGLLWVGSLIWWQSPDDGTEVVYFEVEQGTGAAELAQTLTEQEVIKHPMVFSLYLRASDRGRSVQAGRFALTPGMNYRTLSEALANAGVQEVRVTIPEGYTREQIGETVSAEFSAVNKAEWNAATGPESPLKQDLSVLTALPEGAGLEGYLFPDTYRFRQEATAQDIARRMVENFVSRMNEVGYDVRNGEIAADQYTLHEIVTLASIIEREVQRPDDMRNVSDIFRKRLADGMMLQADSTVNYVIDGDDPSLTLEQTKLDTPYNTYKYTGLPPGPISNPGQNALSAALNPNVNDWYFFLTTPEGEVKYATTFTQHVQNKNQYLD
jgi:UPF0755 protein